jgi:hypothetical protein
MSPPPKRVPSPMRTSAYRIGVRLNPPIQGNVSTRFTIDADGSVSAVANDSATTMADSGVVACVERRIANMQFTAPGGSSSATCAIEFSTE